MSKPIILNPQKANKTIQLLAIILTSILTSIIIIGYYDYTTHPIPHSTPIIKPLEIEVNVTPWGDMYRTEPDCQTDFSVELVHPNQNENLTTNTFEIIVNAGAYKWVVEKAFYTSNLFFGEKWIPISKSQMTVDLQKTFTFNLTNVPDGNHELTLTVIFHEGTRNQTTSHFNVLT